MNAASLPHGSAGACRPHCAACCIAPSISSAIPGMPDGKPAGVPCIQLRADLRCALFGRAERPAVCSSLAPSAEMCGANALQAMHWLATLERQTAPQQQRTDIDPRPVSADRDAR